MSQRRYKQGIDREQKYLLPPSIEEYVTGNNPVRAIDVYVESLDLETLGFQNTEGDVTPGQPAYPPGVLLKLYLYGYLNRVRSSRRLEAECQRNLEVIWLVEGLRPGYKTIADFRKNNLEALKAVNCDFVLVCKELELYGGETVSIDGAYFRGNVGKKSIYTEERLKNSLEHLKKYIDEYLRLLEQADQAEADRPEESREDLQNKLAQLQERQKRNQERLQKLKESGETQLAEVDPDARLLTKPGQTVAGYNVQAVVDKKYKLLVVCQATQAGNDEQQLEPMAKAAQEVLGVDEMEALGDRGYFNSTAIKNCVEAGITPYVAEPNKNSEALLQGRLGKEKFPYDPASNSYTCPNGKVLTYSWSQDRRGKKTLFYTSLPSECSACPLKEQCLPPKSKVRRISRWEHEEVILAHRARMAKKGRLMMELRACLSEHPFGTLKVWWGWTHFLLRGLQKVATETSLLMLSYNFKRVLHIVDRDKFRSFCLQRA